MAIWERSLPHWSGSGRWDQIPIPAGSTPPPGSGGTLSTLELQINVPFLVGKIKEKVTVGSLSKELELSAGKSSYTLDVSEAKIASGTSLFITVGGNKSLLKKAQATAAAPSTQVNVGDLVLGDLNKSNKVDQDDQKVLLDSISAGTGVGDLNGDGLANSLDWSIALKNFARVGQ